MAAQKNRVELKSSARSPMPGAHKVGLADPNEQIQISIFLRRGSDPSQFPSLDDLGMRPPHERVHLSRQDFARIHGAKSSDLAVVRSFASNYGLRVVSEEPARRTVTLSGTVAAFSKAFEAEIANYQSGSVSYAAASGL